MLFRSLQGLLPLPTSPQPTYEDIKTQPKTIPSSSSSGHPYNLIPLDYPLCTNQDDTALFVRTRDLSEIGALQGEWVSLPSNHHHYHCSSNLLVRSLLGLRRTSPPDLPDSRLTIQHLLNGKFDVVCSS